MAVEEIRIRLRHKLEAMFGEDEAAMLMDRPPGGWSDLVTNQTLDARFDALDHRLESLKYELKSDMDKGFRDQTWKMVTALLTTQSVVIGVFGALFALLHG